MTTTPDTAWRATPDLRRTACCAQSGLPGTPFCNSHFRLRRHSFGHTTLAYGARGISYYTYFTYFAPRVGSYRLAPIEQLGSRAVTRHMLRSVNLQIQELVPTYITLKSVNVFHHPNVPDGCRGLDSSVHLTCRARRQGFDARPGSRILWRTGPHRSTASGSPRRRRVTWSHQRTGRPRPHRQVCWRRAKGCCEAGTVAMPRTAGRHTRPAWASGPGRSQRARPPGAPPSPPAHPPWAIPQLSRTGK